MIAFYVFLSGGPTNVALTFGIGPEWFGGDRLGENNCSRQFDGGARQMLMFPNSLSDDQIEVVTATVQKWCQLKQCAVDGAEGRHAVAICFDLVQSSHNTALLDHLISALGPENVVTEEHSGIKTTVRNTRGTASATS